ncbi:helix-turn-helix transcriptional regulator [Bradyrhizobium sp. 186]|uniref:helix-turn-helix domain-containing protein n=1 Tax=Bradyrhizobium sp. 186 TaxID=2782654 RepID=UPI002001676A|nr:helix-turn-helix transcriptional regulator [Bradyrhizobium sp. 186]
MITDAQCRAARGLLAWSQTDLANRSGLSRATVAEFEIGNRRPIANNLAAIRAALESAGVIFLDDGQTIDGGSGVRLARK